MTASFENSEILVEGNSCKRGKEFAILEIIDPKRSLTTTARTAFKDFPVLPVRSDKELPKAMICKAMEQINSVIISKRVKIHEIIIADILGTGCNIVASCDLFDPIKERKKV